MNEIIQNCEREQVTALEQHEQQIMMQCNIQAQSFIETGRLLKAIKDGKEYTVRGYDSFSDYMNEACGDMFPFKSSQAYKYIRVYENYGSRLEQFSGIALDVLDMFREFSAAEFEQIAEENDLKNMSVREAEELKKQLEAATAQLSLFENKANEKEESYKAKIQSANGRIEQLQQYIDELDRKFSESVEKSNKLSEELNQERSRPVEVATAEPDPEIIKEQVDKAVAEEKKENGKNYSQTEKQSGHFGKSKGGV